MVNSFVLSKSDRLLSPAVGAKVILLPTSWRTLAKATASVTISPLFFAILPSRMVRVLRVGFFSYALGMAIRRTISPPSSAEVITSQKYDGMTLSTPSSSDTALMSFSLKPVVETKRKSMRFLSR